MSRAVHAPNPFASLGSSSLPRREFAVVFAALLTVAAGNTALQTVLPAIARVIHMPDMLVAVIFSFSALLWTFFAPYWARQSDMRGRRRLMLVGSLGFMVSMAGCGIAIYAGLNGWLAPIATFALFATLRSLFGIFGSAANPAAQAYVAGRTSEADRTTALSSLSSAFGLGTIIGPAVAPLFILAPFGLAGPMFAFAAIAAVVMLAVARVLPDDDPTHVAGMIGSGAPSSEPNLAGATTGASVKAAAAGRPKRLSVKDSRIAPFMIFGFVSGSIQAATGQALGFLVIDTLGGDALDSQHSIALIFMAGAFSTLLAQWVLIPQFSLTPPALMRWGTLLAAAGTAGIAVSGSLYALVLAFALMSMGYGLARPGFTAGASLAVSRAEQGGVAGAVTSVNGSCFIIAPAIGIGLYQIGPSVTYWLGASALLALAIYAFTKPELNREPGEQPAD
jgi:MFS family permease